MKTFKQILSEAYENRVDRLQIGYGKAEAAVKNKFGTSSFVDLDDLGHLKYTTAENPHDPETNPKEHDEWNESDAGDPILTTDTPAEIRRFSGIMDASNRAHRGLDQRDIRIADKLKTSNPNLYKTYVSMAKNDVLPEHDDHLAKISKRIKSYDTHIKKLINLNAPEQIVQSAREAQQRARDSFDSAGETLQTKLHKRIGQLHSATLKSMNDPNDDSR